ncbi:PA2169 family four-helix-bundle protein [Sediminibacterium ginsengisoli]|uniref:DUF2383 domain-containing protein n=1 Tax=Sediminibacterium ginsengisoli TaxID=413434 RepID=A0A1T4PZP9_9BACT|nr:PA2169 family four-helix-bundle protein [Sediminibacterium ginsengisoli]SJZ96919.1 conserved hypothetical protein [Sediminibacterium ginsengisoli]
MENKQTNIQILNDLIAINNDRIEGYEKAIKELGGKEADLDTLFLSLIDQSRKFRNELGSEVQTRGEQMESGTTTTGKIYRAWMDVKAAFSGDDRQTVLNSCEFGEDAAQKAYRSALESDDLSSYLRELITRQKQELKESHDKVKALRDSVTA